jgi:hypothetical protein
MRKLFSVNRIFVRPTVVEPASDCVDGNTYLSRPFCNSFLLPTNLEKMIASGIVALLLNSSPPTIFLAVRAIIINSVKGFSVWTHTHVVQKVYKTFSPPIANVNPPCAVVMILFAVWVVTSCNHLVIRRTHRMLGKAMSCLSHCGKFSLQAAATFIFPVSQVPPLNGSNRSTLALTNPEIRPALIPVRNRDGSPPSKLSSSQVFHIFTSGNILSHNGNARNYHCVSAAMAALT